MTNRVGMKTFFGSLRWRLVTAFGLVILVTVLLSGILSIWATTNNFDILVTDQGRQQAAEIAPLLEASYALNGDWRDLELLFSETAIVDEGATLEEEGWYSNVDWIQVAAIELGMDDQDLLDQWDALGSLTSVAQSNNTDPNQLITAIVWAEEAAVATAVAKGELPTTEAAPYLQFITESATAFVLETEQFSDDPIEYVDWDKIIASELSLTIEQFYDLWSNQPLAEIVKARKVPPAQIIGAILREERQFVTSSDNFNKTDELLYLADILTQARDYIHLGDALDETLIASSSGGFGFLTSSLFGDEQVLVANADGTIIFDSAREKLNHDLDEKLLSQGIMLWNLEQTEMIGTLIVATGPGFYDAQQTTFLQGVSWSMAISGLLAGVGAFFAGWLVSRRITAPVTALTQASHHIASGHWGERVPISSADELGQMSRAFNAMAETLENQHQLRKRLVDDVSHELQTPLSVIQLELEAMQDGLQSPAQAAQQMQQEIDVLRHLVNDLSSLSEIDEDGIQLAKEPVNLLAMTQQTVTRWQSKAEEAGVTLFMEPSANLPMIQADPLRLAQVLGNLLSNGIRHAPNGRIQVRCRQEVCNGRSWLVTTVQDNGEGIPTEDIPYIFERFYRADDSRNRDSGGRGLGLAIVKQIIELHRGWVTAVSQPGAGSTVEYWLPIS